MLVFQVVIITRVHFFRSHSFLLLSATVLDKFLFSVLIMVTMKFAVAIHVVRVRLCLLHVHMA